jgi:hypothetical protein
MRLRPFLRFAFTGCLAISAGVAAQQVPNEPNQLTVSAKIPPRLFLHQQYQVRLEAQGGVAPYNFEVSEGSLPRGLNLREDGILDGTPISPGEFRATVTVTDGARPAHARDLRIVLRVVAPLAAEWTQPPHVSGRRIEGVIKLTNETDQDFDLTFVVLAVNETGRATTIGYQRFTLKQDTAEMEVPFGENLPAGTYEVNADVVGEVAAAGNIFRARLVMPGLRVQQGP